MTANLENHVWSLYYIFAMIARGLSETFSTQNVKNFGETGTLETATIP